MERYQLNMQRKFQSLIPMERVSWNLANSGVEVDFSLFGSIRFYLQRSLHKTVTTLKRLKQNRVTVINQVNHRSWVYQWFQWTNLTGIQSDDMQLRFCENCNCELLILLWIMENSDSEEPSTPFCEDCALAQEGKTWVVIQQFSVKKLQTMYDKLKLKLSWLLGWPWDPDRGWLI